MLLSLWLSSDSASRQAIVASLRERGVGTTDVADDAQYLGTCRNTIGLRRVVLPVFIAMGEIARDEMGSVPAPAAESSDLARHLRLTKDLDWAEVMTNPP